jgi:hypothetical protein
MDRTVVEAKNEIAAFLDHRLKELGLEGFKKQLALEFHVEEDEKHEE